MCLVDREELGAEAETHNGNTNGVKHFPMLGRMSARPNLLANALPCFCVTKLLGRRQGQGQHLGGRECANKTDLGLLLRGMLAMVYFPIS